MSKAVSCVCVNEYLPVFGNRRLFESTPSSVEPSVGSGRYL